MLKSSSPCTLTLLLFDPADCAWSAAFMLLIDYIKSEIHYCINFNLYHHITILYHLCSYSTSEA